MTATTGELSASALVEALSSRSASGLTDELSALIRRERLAVGTRLPTIRAMAQSLGVSVGTVAEAWASLRAQGLVETRRRGGTHVVAPSTPRPFAGWSGVDFLLSSPDTSLQPPLESALLSALRQPGVNAWGREHMVAALRDAVAPTWPFHAEGWTTAGGGTEGLWLATRAIVPPGALLAVEEPAPPGYLATVAEMGVRVIGVPVDDEGPLPGAVRAAIDAGASAFVHQPGGPFSTRHVLSAKRAEELASVLEGDVAIIEDDSLGPLSAVPVQTLGQAFPHRTLRVLSYCRAFGLDLRTSVVGGAKGLVDRVIAVRSGGVASNSRILQHALAAMVQDTAAAETVVEARAHYAARRRLALEAFRDVGLTAHSGPGSMVVWVEVADERTAAQALASIGIVADVGTTAFVSPPAPGLMRFSTAQLPEDPDMLAEFARLVDRAVRGDLRIHFD